MQDDEFNLKKVVTKAWGEAWCKANEKGLDNTQQGNSKKASEWVDCLARGFEENYDTRGHQRVFWGKNPRNQAEFRLNELLFDIMVCEIGEVCSIIGEKKLEFVKKCYWQVESELNNKDSRELTIDFSKLVMGHSENKLFVSSYQGEMKSKAKELCSKIAPYCAGHLFLCFIPHPNDWNPKSPPPDIFEWTDRGWREISHS